MGDSLGASETAFIEHNFRGCGERKSIDMLKEFVEKKLNPGLRRFGGAVVPAHKETSLPAVMARLRKKGIKVETVIDIGASYGKWAEVVMEYYPQAKYLLIEAQEVHLQKLVEFKKKQANVDFVLAAAGNRVGQIFFDATDPYGGRASDTPIEGEDKNIVRVPVTTVDREVAERNYRGPFLVKLDTHGFELPILEGASTALYSASVVVIEVYNFVIAEGAIRFHEMVSFMEEKGFRVADMCDPVFRPSDGIFWQMDLVFLRADEIAFANTHF